ncbi:hypothetical protein Back11_23220 [Paenibacillus baekrokdamisoli]|uniref:Uncharacterized protein n=1 Tax=Paenibacillus baekrokdamisoli TaxID=1712516 RepID=A0A3G9IQ25_9BACL|nr:hypothetical protein [Paenibacillus baekrokdamisoli]BBH20977.1 hypothetical protein Back11_23220 [Paenibacillus baekrokdamisoli]
MRILSKKYIKKKTAGAAREPIMEMILVRLLVILLLKVYTYAINSRNATKILLLSTLDNIPLFLHSCTSIVT